jgi:hypothetical protein
VPPRFGQRGARFASAQARQPVRSKRRIMAAVLSAGRSASPRSRFGRSASMGALLSDALDRAPW